MIWGEPIGPHAEAFVPTPMKVGTFSCDFRADVVFAGRQGSTRFKRALNEDGTTLRLTGRHCYDGGGRYVAEYDDETGALHWRCGIGRRVPTPPETRVRHRKAVRFTDGTVRGAPDGD